MTKINFFGDVIHTPKDSPSDFALFAEEMEAGGFYAARIGDDGNDDFGWCASVDMNDKPGDLSVHGFESEAALRNWLIEAGVPEGEIEIES